MSDADKFPGGADMLERSLQRDEKQFQAWRKHIERLSQDPDLVVLNDFERVRTSRSTIKS